MLKLLKAGFFTTVQDGGRFGYRHRGVPVAGVMDAIAATYANLMLDNDMGDAVLEIAMTGPTIRFGAPTYICLAGADFSVTLNDKEIEQLNVYKVQKGDILSYGRLKNGFRSYLAVRNGFTSPLVLGSRSYFFPITTESHLAEQAIVAYAPVHDFIPQKKGIFTEPYFNGSVLEVAPGPEYHLLNDKQLEALFFNLFQIAKENNRMAYQLQESIIGHEISMLTSATLPGTVQLTPAGKLIILMKDGQTTGGYPRILQLSDRAIAILAQKKANDHVSFKLFKTV